MLMSVHEGQVLDGKYQVVRILGQGGMGVVIAAKHLELGHLVALKLLLPSACAQPEAVMRFLREARAVARLQSEHVARVSDVGRLDTGAPYIVMEYLRGSDLAEVLRVRGRLPIAEAVGYVLQACEAVAEAHSVGVIHRDLKPANLFLTRRPDGSALVKVLDFGVSKALHDETLSGPREQVTVANAILGSPHYMSPEQIRNSTAVDARSDVWALGMILHELVTGSPAYSADTLPALLAMIVADPPLRLRAGEPSAPAELERLVLWCLEKNRERRCPSVAELARGLAPFASESARSSVERISRILAPGATRQSESSSQGAPGPERGAGGPPSGGASAWTTTQRAVARRRRGVIVLAAASLAALTVGATYWARVESRPPSAPTISGMRPAGPATSAGDAAAALGLAPASGVSPTASTPSVASAPSAARSAAPASASALPRARASAPLRPGPRRSPLGRDDLFDDAK